MTLFSGDMLDPIVTALQETITVTDVISLFSSGVKVALPLILTWFGAKWVYKRFSLAVRGGRG